MDATTLAQEAIRYLEAIDLFRSLELDARWRFQAEECRPGMRPPGMLGRQFDVWRTGLTTCDVPGA
jgi:hypothetical protein